MSLKGSENEMLKNSQQTSWVEMNNSDEGNGGKRQQSVTNLTEKLVKSEGANSQS